MKGPSRKSQSTKGPTHEETTPKGPYRRGMSLRPPLVLYIKSDLYQSKESIIPFTFTLNTLSVTLDSTLSARKNHEQGLNWLPGQGELAEFYCSPQRTHRDTTQRVASRTRRELLQGNEKNRGTMASAPPQQPPSMAYSRLHGLRKDSMAMAM